MIGRLTGQAVQRVEDRRILTGTGRYVDDLQPDGLLHAAFVRSTAAHADLEGVDVAPAAALPGVAGAWNDREMRLIASDIVPTTIPGLVARPFPVLARDRVRAVGEPVAMVVAGSRAEAEDGCEAVTVDYRPRVAVLDAAAAATPGAPLLFEGSDTNVVYRSHHRVGDPDRAFAAASTVIRETFVQHRHANVPLEGHGGVASFDSYRGELDYFASHQNPHALRINLARLLDIPAAKVRVRCGDIGGAFGQKGHLLREDVAVCAASVQLGRPVKWIEDRSENLVFGGQAREETLEVEAAVDAYGVVQALRVRMTLDQGAYPMLGFAAAAITNLVRVLLPGPYRIAAVDFEAVVVATNKATYVPYRGPWEAETWLRERVLDVVARALTLDPVELRQRNLWPDDAVPAQMCTGPQLTGISPHRVLATAVDAVGYREFRDRQERERGRGRYLGIGVVNVLEPAPLPPSVVAAMGATAAPRTVQQARLRLEPDGTFSLYTSQQPHGQGHETTLAQLAADAIGVPIESIRVVHGDTAVTPFNMVGTGGSRSANLASGAVLEASRLARHGVLAMAARLLEIDAGDLDVVDGRVSPRGAPARAVELARLADLSYRAPGLVNEDGAPGLEVTGSYTSGEGTWSQACHAAEVEVDVETGQVRVRRYVVVEDCGPVINPAVVDGQVRGGVAQGIGAVLLERSAYSGDGTPISSTLMDYLLPSSLDIPAIEVRHLHGPPRGPVDHRGVGEGGAIGAPAAVCAAVEDALAPFGVTIREQYLPPYRILEMLGRV